MIKRYQLDNGWVIEKDNDHNPVLYVTPIPNTLFRKNQKIEVDDKVFMDIANGERSIKRLFEKHNIHKLIIRDGSIDVKTKYNLYNTPNKFYGRGFIATQEGGRYFLEYQLARHGGGSRKFEIDKKIYEDARTGKHSTSDLFKKYDLYHLDVPENDV